MALTELPTAPGPAAVRWRLVDFGGTQRGLLGGASQRINRLGNRWAIEVDLPPLDLADARRWAAALVLGRQTGVRWKLRQPGLRGGVVGAPLVAGAAQTGFALAADGFAPGAAWEAGQFIAVASAGARALYMTATAAVASAAGAGTIALTTPLRITPADNDAIEFAPKIEGLLVGDEAGWTIDAMRLGRAGFSIEEAA